MVEAAGTHYPWDDSHMRIDMVPHEDLHLAVQVVADDEVVCHAHAVRLRAGEESSRGEEYMVWKGCKWEGVTDCYYLARLDALVNARVFERNPVGQLLMMLTFMGWPCP